MQDPLPGAVPCLTGAIVAFLCLLCSGEEAPVNPGARANFRSPNFSVWTDLPEVEAQQLLDRLEAVLAKTERYWARPQRGSIQCYVVRNLDAWHDRELPNPMARLLISRVGGVAVSYPDEDAAQIVCALWCLPRRGQVCQNTKLSTRIAVRRLVPRARLGTAKVWRKRCRANRTWLVRSDSNSRKILPSA